MTAKSERQSPPNEVLALTPEMLELIAERFKVLSELTRLKLIVALKSGEKNVTKLVQATGATQANVSCQLRTLTNSGILSRRKSGLKVYYTIADPAIFELCEHVCGSLKERFQRHYLALD